MYFPANLVRLSNNANLVTPPKSSKAAVELILMINLRGQCLLGHPVCLRVLYLFFAVAKQECGCCFLHG